MSAPGPGAVARPPRCDDPTHDERCDCGADPDWEYEKEKEARFP